MCQLHPHLVEALIAERQHRQDDHRRVASRRPRSRTAAVAHERQRAFVLASLVWSRKEGDAR
jgi:hypothetical protein